MKNITLAIIEVMKDVEWVAKNMTVWKWDNAYNWVSDKDVRIVMRESMIKNWLSLLPIQINPTIRIDRWEEEDPYSKSVPKAMRSKQSVFTEVSTKYLLVHTSGESIEVSWYWQGVDSQDKWAGKATTYAMKNTLLNMFLVPTGIDTDNTHSDDIDVPKSQYVWGEVKKWLNHKDMKEMIEKRGYDTEVLLKNVIKDEGWTLSQDAKNALRHYCDKGEIISY